MLNLDDISQETLLARGKYATVRGAHEDAKKELSILCGSLQSIPSQILKRMQPDNDEPADVSDLLAMGRALIDQVKKVATNIESLATQRKALKEEAWSNG